MKKTYIKPTSEVVLINMTQGLLAGSVSAPLSDDVQDNGDANVEIGNYPIVNVYANMFLKHARFYVMMSHVNKGEGGQTFLVPHYPFNERILRLGISWNFFN